MSSYLGEQPLPRYGLAGSLVGERWAEGEGWDICTTVHRFDDRQEELSIGVIRRTTARSAKGASRVAISADLARHSVAKGLVLDNPNSRGDVFAAIDEVARDDNAWTAREIKVDGEMVTGYEREYEGMWVVYYLTATLIIFMLAPVALRPDTVELRRLGPNEVNRREEP